MQWDLACRRGSKEKVGAMGVAVESKIGSAGASHFSPALYPARCWNLHVHHQLFDLDRILQLHAHSQPLNSIIHQQ